MSEQLACIIVDDEPAAHLVLKNHILKDGRIVLAAQFYNIVDARAFLESNNVDLILLDIQLPEITGLEFLRSYPNAPKTILTTAFSQYALESYDYAVVDYLLKPISQQHFQRAIDRFISYIATPTPAKKEFLTIKVDREMLEIEQKDIDYVQSFGNYVKVFMGEAYYLASTTTQEIIQDLSPEAFVRIHKSYVVNLKKITSYEDRKLVLGSVELPIGLIYKREVMRKLELLHSRD
ncbi:LytR/AlgR family response regulator transcription factor [Sphingobacterium sp. LRF_L2]|uniref:LytR/AlgR family response regulator transcription factor n=1 Tax=Sphingobacterium sp. LRF_L2 TaxID=3369421 RepID=UPI003F5E2BFB